MTAPKLSCMARNPKVICITYCIANPIRAITMIHRERSYRLFSHLTCRWESATKKALMSMNMKHANNWVFRNILPFIDNHKMWAKKVVWEIFELLLTQRWHKYHFIDLHNQKTKSENYRCFQCYWWLCFIVYIGKSFPKIMPLLPHFDISGWYIERKAWQ